MNEKNTAMLKKVGFNYIADERAEFLSVEIFRVLAYRVITEPFFSRNVKKWVRSLV